MKWQRVHGNSIYFSRINYWKMFPQVYPPEINLHQRNGRFIDVLPYIAYEPEQTCFHCQLKGSMSNSVAVGKTILWVLTQKPSKSAAQWMGCTAQQRKWRSTIHRMNSASAAHQGNAACPNSQKFNSHALFYLVLTWFRSTAPCFLYSSVTLDFMNLS